MPNLEIEQTGRKLSVVVALINDTTRVPLIRPILNSVLKDLCRQDPYPPAEIIVHAGVEGLEEFGRRFWRAPALSKSVLHIYTGLSNSHEQAS